MLTLQSEARQGTLGFDPLRTVSVANGIDTMNRNKINGSESPKLNSVSPITRNPVNAHIADAAVKRRISPPLFENPQRLRYSTNRNHRKEAKHNSPRSAAICMK